MQQYTRIKEDAAEDDIGAGCSSPTPRSSGSTRVIRWLDAADARIKRLADARRRRPVAAPAATARVAESDGPAMTAVLELRGVSKSYGEGTDEVHALRDVDLSVLAGELVAIMGPSGSGKSTLLTIAGTLEEPTAGDVLVDGVDLSSMSRNDRARLRRRSIGYVFQDFNLLAGLTAVGERLACRSSSTASSAQGGARPALDALERARRRRARRALSRRAVRRRAATRRDRPRGRRRPAPAARRRAHRRARLGQRRGGDAARRAPRASAASPASS